ncbi:MPN domain-containing protein [Psychroserpens ponticola]|uniref:JAB domain-containing protein n=1 Tax=Psychroserpens ponticola TaxID=2932268 RepID=A0ABY7S2Q6_9FLAO|nr:hypothetical protein [Psychroserpens ponticola]WCO03573.1 hypothetical protein MUN68_008700 [Psychroserpens ponticola]
MLTPQNIISIFEEHGLPEYGLTLDFLPTQSLIRKMSERFKIEFAIMFTINNGNYYCIYKGTSNSVELPIDAKEILLSHTHPNGTIKPSIHDINWLKTAQSVGSPQIQSVILPIGKKRVTFNINSPFLK